MRTCTIESADQRRLNIRAHVVARAILAAVIAFGTTASIWGMVRVHYDQAQLSKRVEAIAARITTPPLAPITARD